MEQHWIIQEPSDPVAKLETQQARQQNASNYWIAAVPPEIIKDHLDIWACTSLRAFWVWVVDVNSLFIELVTRPAAFGFKNSVQAAFDPNTGKVVPDPNDFLFWDGFHPTTNAHLFAAEFIYFSIISNLQLF